MRVKRLILLAASISLVALWGCSSSMDSGGDQTGQGTTLADALPVGMNNCLTCHNPATTIVQQWLASRHGNRMLAAGKLPNDTEIPPDDPEPSIVTAADPCRFCHRIEDTGNIDYAYLGQFGVQPGSPPNTVWSLANADAPFISCENCHGGGQFHYGIPSGIPFPEPSTKQCAQCHYLTDALADPEAIAENAIPFHTGSSSGNNVRRNIFDSHIDNPATDDLIEGYVVKNDGTGGCNSCHIAHEFDLTINYQWGNSPHGGHIKAVKDAALAAGAPDAATLLVNVTAAAVDETTGDAWVHYDWDAGNRQSCQRCHTSTGLMNFLADTVNYDTTGNDYSHLEGWSKAADGTVTSSGQNEMLYCWGCHANTQTGEVRDDPDGITLDFVFLDINEDPSGTPEFVVLPDKGKANVCAACHAGRGNNNSIRDDYAEAAAEPDPADRDLSSRFAGHHAPTAGSLYAEVTHTGFEFDGQDYTPEGSFLHDDIGTADTAFLVNTDIGDGPCVSCHMAGSADHHFEAVDRTGATVITNQALCNECHGSVDGPFLDTLKTSFEAARQILLDLVSNAPTRPNYLGIDISADDNRNSDTLSLNDFGTFQNSLYMQEEPCVRIHNYLYGKRVMFDSIDWLEDGVLDGTINSYGGAESWMGGTTRP